MALDVASIAEALVKARNGHHRRWPGEAVPALMLAGHAAALRLVPLQLLAEQLTFLLETLGAPGRFLESRSKVVVLADQHVAFDDRLLQCRPAAINVSSLSSCEKTGEKGVTEDKIQSEDAWDGSTGKTSSCLQRS